MRLSDLAAVLIGAVSAPAAQAQEDGQEYAVPCDHAGHQGDQSEAKEEHDLETENLFGFTLGADVERMGARVVALETVLRAGKNVGRYQALGQKIEFGYGLRGNLSVAVALLGALHRVQNVPGFDDRDGRYRLTGVGGEVRWRVMDRAIQPVGLTLHLEPEFARIDELSGERGLLMGSENKLIVDREIVSDRLFAAFNLLYDLERFAADREVERLSTFGAGLALTTRVSSKVWLGGEVRVLRAHEGLLLNDMAADAVFLGPTLHARLGEKGWLSLAWQRHLGGRGDSGHTAGSANCAAPTAHAAEFASFEQHHLRLKVGIEF